jgi:hypothetical protein
MNVKFANNTSKWQMEFYSAFKGLSSCVLVSYSREFSLFIRQHTFLRSQGIRRPSEREQCTNGLSDAAIYFLKEKSWVCLIGCDWRKCSWNVLCLFQWEIKFPVEVIVGLLSTSVYNPLSSSCSIHTHPHTHTPTHTHTHTHPHTPTHTHTRTHTHTLSHSQFLSPTV